MSANLDTHRIDLWYASPADIRDEALLDTYRGLLTEAERAQAQRFYFAKDRQRYLVTRALVRTTLSRYIPIDPRHWVFSPNAYGRPYIANQEALSSGLFFNITHTGNLIVLAVTQGRELGVDAEHVTARDISLDIADNYFVPSEVDDLYAQAEAHRQQRFFEYWTLKESYIKARGMGLSIPLDQFSFQLPPDNDIQLSIHPGQDDVASRWHFWQWQLPDDYLCALCVERMPRLPTLAMRHVVPLVAEHALECRFLRATSSNQ